MFCIVIILSYDLLQILDPRSVLLTTVTHMLPGGRNVPACHSRLQSLRVLPPATIGLHGPVASPGTQPLSYDSAMQ